MYYFENDRWNLSDYSACVLNIDGNNLCDFLSNLSQINKNTALFFFNADDNDTDFLSRLSNNENLNKVFIISGKPICSDKISNVCSIRRITKRTLKSYGITNVFVLAKLNIGADYAAAKTIVKGIITLEKVCRKCGVEFGITDDNQRIIGNVLKSEAESNTYADNIAQALLAASISDTRGKYEFIYDMACDYLDSQFKEHNYCDFKDNHCKMVRKYNCKDPAMAGCCHSYRLFRVLTVDFMYDHRPCIHIKPGGCTEKCIGCKLYTCDILKKDGVRFSLNKILLTDCFFSVKQKMVMKNNYFRRKDEIINKLIDIAKDRSTLVWFYLCGKHMIRTKFE